MAGPSPDPWWWVAPTYNQTRAGFLKRVVPMAEKAGILLDYTTAPPLRAILINHALIEARSWEKPSGLYGDTVRGMVVDEFGLLTEDAYTALSSRRAETLLRGQGFARYLGNVGQVGGQAEKLWKRAKAGAYGFQHRRWTWRERAMCLPCACGNGAPIPVDITHWEEHREECPQGVYLSFLAEERARLSRNHFEQLYEASWVDWSKDPAYTYNRLRNSGADAEALAWDRSLPLDVSCDFNVSPMAWTLGQHTGSELRTLDEICIEGQADTAAACKEVIRRMPDRSWAVEVFGDASGRAKDTRSKTSDYAIIRNVLGEYYRSYTERVPLANPSVSNRINAANAMFANFEGEPRWWIHPRCERTCTDFARVGLKPGTREIDKSDKSMTHFSDADGYRAAELFPVDVVMPAPVIHVPDTVGENPITEMAW